MMLETDKVCQARDVKTFHKPTNVPKYHGSVTVNSTHIMDLFFRGAVYLDESIYLGISILDYGKNMMYSFYYDVTKPMWADNTRLVLTDTDSFMFAIKTNDLLEDIKQISDLYDLSKMPGELNNKSHKKVPGYMTID